MSANNILIIDDEERLCQLLSRIIALEGFEVFEANNLKTGFKKLKQHDIDVVICDVKLPDGNGVDIVQEIKAKYPLCEVILLTAYGNIPDSVQAIKNGAFDYITKGDDNNRVIPLLYRAINKVQLAKRVSQLEKRIAEKHSFDTIIGKSKSFLSALELGKKVASTDTTVLLLGETGTGKEVFSQAIHEASTRKNKPFVAINCSAFTRELLESEMFGYKTGAFTGATNDKKGLFEEANNGTIFLDEIGEMALELQAKLLRVIETGEFIRVGDSSTTKVNVRIIAATNRDLQKEIETGHFRQDLFYRLSVFQITLPPLRERIVDLELFARYFTTVFSAKTNKRIAGINSEFIEALKKHSWPGNIRELKNIIERSVILSNEDTLTNTLLPYEIQHHSSNRNGTLSAFAMASVEKLHIQKVLNYTKGNKAEASRLLEIGVATLYRKLDEYGLN